MCIRDYEILISTSRNLKEMSEGIYEYVVHFIDISLPLSMIKHVNYGTLKRSVKIHSMVFAEELRNEIISLKYRSKN